MIGKNMGRMLVISFVVLFFLSTIYAGTVHGSENFVVKKNVDAIKGYTSHGVIRINNNTDFANQAAAEGWPGDGSQGNPYIISGYDIDAHGAGDAIYIGNTTVYFVIKNCYLHNASYHSWPYFLGAGINLYNVTYGILENNTYSNNLEGIMLYSSSSNILKNNTCSSNNDDGIYLWDSSSNVITNNTCSSNNWSGILLDSSSSNVITNNTCSSNNEHGIFLGVSSNNKLYDNKLINNGIFLLGGKNTFTTEDIPTNNTVNGKPVYYYKNVNMNNASVPLDAGQVILGNVSWLKIENLNIYNASVAIEIGYSSNITISNNTCSNNTESGIDLWSSSSNIITNDTCSSNNWNGIYLWHSSNNVIFKNLFANNINYGAYIDSYSSHNLIYNNSFYYNHGSGDIYNSSHVQAYDGGTNNSWNSTTGIGNYWHDWANNNDTNDLNPHDGIVDWPYKIDGGSAKDYYPLKNATYPMPPLAPTAPQNLQASPGNGYVNLTWQKPLGNGSSPITNYKIYRDGVLIDIVSATQLWFNDTSVTNGQTYTYYVTANNSVGESEPSNKVQATPGGAVPEFPAIWLVVITLLLILGTVRKIK